MTDQSTIRDQIAAIVDPTSYSDTYAARKSHVWGSKEAARERQVLLRDKALAKADAILELLAASSGDPAACPNCNGKLWVCENHPTQTNWEDCCGVGMMCGVCCREEIIRGAVFHAEKRIAELEAASSGEREKALEEAARVAECAFDDRPNSRSGHHSEMDWTDGYRDGTRAAAHAIRALSIGEIK